MLLASPKSRRPGRRAEWFVEAYRWRWGVEDATRGVKQQFHLEKFLVRTWKSIRRLLWLVAMTFFFLAQPLGRRSLRPPLRCIDETPWRLPKEVTYLFDWIATMIQQLLHPKPKLSFAES